MSKESLKSVLVIDEISFSKAPLEGECAIAVTAFSEGAEKVHASGKISFKSLPACFETELLISPYKEESSCLLSLQIKQRHITKGEKKAVYRTTVSFVPSDSGGPGFNINKELCFSVKCHVESNQLNSSISEVK